MDIKCALWLVLLSDIAQNQSASISLNQSQSASITINQYQLASITNNQNKSASYQSASKDSSVLVGWPFPYERKSASISINQCTAVISCSEVKQAAPSRPVPQKASFALLRLVEIDKTRGAQRGKADCRWYPLIFKVGKSFHLPLCSDLLSRYTF